MGCDCTIGAKHPSEFKKFVHAAMEKKLKGTGISVSAAMFLAELEEDRGMTNRELTERVGFTKALTTRVTRQLEEKGLVEITPSGRECSISLTPKGRETRAMARRCQAEVMDYIFSGLTEEELEFLNHIHRKMDERIDAFYEEQRRKKE